MKLKYLLLAGMMLSAASCSYDIEKYNIYDENYDPNNQGGDDNGDDNKPSTVTTVESIAELISYISQDNVNVKLKAGMYKIDDASLFAEHAVDSYSNGNMTAENGYKYVSLLEFSGSNNTVDLTGVDIYADVDKIFAELGKDRIFFTMITGDNNEISGMNFVCTSEMGYPIKSGETVGYPKDSAINLVVQGDHNTLTDVSIYPKGSFPYGYGFLFGKTQGSNSKCDIKKQSSLLICGTGTTLKGCKVVTSAFGHGIVMQGAVDTVIEDCYVQGYMRKSDDMLAEVAGELAFDLKFASYYNPGTIQPGYMIALSEDGVRTYASGSLTGTKTKNVTVINTTVKNMRSGFDLVACDGERTITGCTTIGTQTQGYSGGTGITISKSKGDAMYGPLFSHWYTSGTQGSMELELVADEDSEYTTHFLGEINGSKHNVKITNFEGKKRATPLKIVFGESFYDWQNSWVKGQSPFSYSGGSYNTLVNETGMPIYVRNNSSSCEITTNGTVEDNGVNTKITYVE